MRRSNFALRLQPGLLDEARRAAVEEGVALNQLINVAVAEKVAALRTAAFFRERASRGSTAKALKILARAGVDNPPMPGDELPPDFKGQATRTSLPGRASRKSRAG
ncbi:hypothetical protein [Vineibacter terrae]|uniref:hypothetical protein n=1 Tax=Vineibacter terrae TaxID=2586908 RepID=UPI001C49A6C8|nr:hypothetical protein [Vineibacter terrae]